MQNSEYWSNRLDKLVASLLLTQENHTNTFLSNYKDALIQIQAYSNLLYSKYSKDGVLTLTEMYKFDRYKNMEEEITSIIMNLGKEEKLYMTGELTEVYSNSYVKTGAILLKGIPTIAIKFDVIPTGFVEKALFYPWSGTDFVTRIGVNNKTLISNLRQTLTRGFINGSSITNMTKDLKGVMDIGATNARRLVRTEAMHIMASSHHDVYTKAGVTEVKFITAKDDRVCDECGKLNGKIFPINEAPMIPQHPNSRSVNVPYFKD